MAVPVSFEVMAPTAGRYSLTWVAAISAAVAVSLVKEL